MNEKSHNGNDSYEELNVDQIGIRFFLMFKHNAENECDYDFCLHISHNKFIYLY